MVAMSARKIIEASSDKLTKVMFRHDVLAATGFGDLSVDDMGESMWVERVKDLGGKLKLGKLRNDSFCFSMEFGDYVVYYHDEWRVAVAAYSAKDSTLNEILADIQQNAEQFINSGRAEVESIADRISCARCKDRDAMSDDKGGRGVWVVTDKAWKKVPSRFRNKVLCKKCFRDLTGLDPEEHRRFNRDGSLREL